MYRDDGIGIAKLNKQQWNRLEKRLHSIFKKHGLKITVQAGMKSTDYLDVLFDIPSASHKPFTKPNNTVHYVNIASNHPKATTKQLPLGVQQRLASLSSSEEKFMEEAPPYQDALNRAGYSHILKYEKRTAKRRRTRNILYYTPPFSKAMNTNLTSAFNQLVKKHFPIGSVLAKIFNPNCLKISCSTTVNMASLVSAHNKKILEQQGKTTKELKLCNCRYGPQTCPVNGECLRKDLVYCGRVDVPSRPHLNKSYVGLTSTTFKTRWNNHKTAIENRDSDQSTTLSSYIWSLKDQGLEPTTSFSLMRRAAKYTIERDSCNLCPQEKLTILEEGKRLGRMLLNTRKEIFTKCMHKRKHLLSQRLPT